MNRHAWKRIIHDKATHLAAHLAYGERAAERVALSWTLRFQARHKTYWAPSGANSIFITTNKKEPTRLKARHPCPPTRPVLTASTRTMLNNGYPRKVLTILRQYAHLGANCI